MRGTRLIIGVLCVGLLAAAPGTATTPQPTQQPTLQTGDLADTCENATVLESGMYNGTLSPGDTDVFRVEAIGEGNYIAFNFSFEGGTDAVEMEAYESENEYAAAIFTGPDGGNFEDAFGDAHFRDDRGEDPTNIIVLPQQDEGAAVYSFRLYAEDNQPLCIRFHTRGPEAAGWQLGMTTQDTEAPPIACPETQDAELTTNG